MNEQRKDAPSSAMDQAEGRKWDGKHWRAMRMQQAQYDHLRTRLLLKTCSRVTGSKSSVFPRLQARKRELPMATKSSQGEDSYFRMMELLYHTEFGEMCPYTAVPPIRRRGAGFLKLLHSNVPG
jgi:hypothetical protein